MKAHLIMIQEFKFEIEIMVTNMADNLVLFLRKGNSKVLKRVFHIDYFENSGYTNLEFFLQNYFVDFSKLVKIHEKLVKSFSTR